MVIESMTLIIQKHVMIILTTHAEKGESKTRLWNAIEQILLLLTPIRLSTLYYRVDRTHNWILQG